MFRHEQRFLSLAQTVDPVAVRRVRYYDKTHDYPGVYINEEHRALGIADRNEWGGLKVEVQGWLYTPDALKLYELAYFASGDILELGTGPGLSTYVLMQALLASGRDAGILTVDLNTKSIGKALHQLAGRPGLERINFWCIKAVHALQELAHRNRQFGFVFIDDSHVYEDVRNECRALAPVLVPGGFVLIHDYCDVRNVDHDNKKFAVYQGVQKGLDNSQWEFWGIYGCAGLFRRRYPT